MVCASNFDDIEMMISAARYLSQPAELASYAFGFLRLERAWRWLMNQIVTAA